MFRELLIEKFVCSTPPTWSYCMMWKLGAASKLFYKTPLPLGLRTAKKRTPCLQSNCFGIPPFLMMQFFKHCAKQ